MFLPVAAPIAGVLAAAAGCAASPGDDGVRTAAAGLFEAVEHGDGGRACAALTPAAADRLESAGSGCAERILKLGLEGGRIGRAEVWGDWARVRAGADTVFLNRWGRGWRVAAAGCQQRAGQTYDCKVEA